jgi:hypothetical protein
LYVAAIARGVNVGVDIEPSCRLIGDVRTFSARWLHPEEAALVGDNSSQLLAKWTQKEAVVKASGRGIGHGGMRGFCVGAEGTILVENRTLPNWQLFDFGFPSVDSRGGHTGDRMSHVGCVAVESSTAIVEHWFYSECDELVGVQSNRSGASA